MFKSLRRDEPGAPAFSNRARCRRCRLLFDCSNGLGCQGTYKMMYMCMCAYIYIYIDR